MEQPKFSMDEKEKNQLLDSIGDLIIDIISNLDKKSYSDYNFEGNIKNEVFANFDGLIDYDTFTSIYDENIEQIYLKNNIIKRSYKNINFDIKINSEKIKDQINYLKNLPQPEQKTEDWYKFRKNHITGSNAWKIFGTESSRRSLICEKLQPDDLCIIKSNLSESPLNWGHKYEPLSIMFYEYFNDTKVDEFGCIPHKEIDYLAASPDGIVVGENNMGRMVEIKNVVSREITKIPKMEYYIQMQLQMEVCDLNDCDFIETKFIEYDSFEDFKKDKYEIRKGMIIILIKNNSSFIYEYSNLFKNSENELNEFTENVYKKYNFVDDNLEENGIKWFKNVYWKLNIFSCVYVPRNKEWFNSCKELMNDFWNIIENERQQENAYLKYKPKPRKVKDQQISNVIKLN